MKKINKTAFAVGEYLEEEYKAQNRDRAETRKHISFETSIENGHDYISGENSPMDMLL